MVLKRPFKFTHDSPERRFARRGFGLWAALLARSSHFCDTYALLRPLSRATPSGRLRRSG